MKTASTEHRRQHHQATCWNLPAGQGGPYSGGVDGLEPEVNDGAFGDACRGMHAGSAVSYLPKPPNLGWPTFSCFVHVDWLVFSWSMLAKAKEDPTR
eukprot:3937674-Rhodomonas_salina.1